MEFTRDSKHIKQGLLTLRLGIGVYICCMGLTYLLMPETAYYRLFTPYMITDPTIARILAWGIGGVITLVGASILVSYKKKTTLYIATLILTLLVVEDLWWSLQSTSLLSILQVANYFPALLGTIALRQLESFDSKWSLDHQRKEGVQI